MGQVTPPRRSGLKLFFGLFLLVLVGVLSFYFVSYIRLLEPPSSDVDERISELESRADAEVRAAVFDVFLGWAWRFGLVIGVLLVAYWVLKAKRHAPKKGYDKVSCMKAMEKELAASGFYTVWRLGHSWKRREGSSERVVLGIFSSEPVFMGTRPALSFLMYGACVNDRLDHTVFLDPSEGRKTFRQFVQWLHELEILGFSVEKTRELAAIESLLESDRKQQIISSEKANLLTQAGFIKSEDV